MVSFVLSRPRRAPSEPNAARGGPVVGLPYAAVARCHSCVLFEKGAVWMMGLLRPEWTTSYRTPLGFPAAHLGHFLDRALQTWKA